MASEQIKPFRVVKGDIRGCVQRTDTEGHGPHCCGGGMGRYGHSCRRWVRLGRWVSLGQGGLSRQRGQCEQRPGDIKQHRVAQSC